MQKIILIVAVTFMFSLAAFSQDDKGDAWKSSWDAYVDEVIGCMNDSSCHLGQKFGDAVVTWDGTFEAVGSRIVKEDRTSDFKADQYNIKRAVIMVRLHVKPRTIPFTFSGTELKLETPKVLEVGILEGSLKSWKAIKKGTQVRFRVTLNSFGQDVGGLGRYGVSIGYSMKDAAPAQKKQNAVPVPRTRKRK